MPAHARFFVRPGRVVTGVVDTLAVGGGFAGHLLVSPDRATTVDRYFSLPMRAVLTRSRRSDLTGSR